VIKQTITEAKLGNIHKTLDSQKLQTVIGGSSGYSLLPQDVGERVWSVKNNMKITTMS
jgi:hypothetical protein